MNIEAFIRELQDYFNLNAVGAKIDNYPHRLLGDSLAHLKWCKEEIKRLKEEQTTKLNETQGTINNLREQLFKLGTKCAYLEEIKEIHDLKEK